MSTDIKVPNLPESVSSATVATWHKKVGDTVQREENLVDLETDKVMLEVPATIDGVLEAIQAQPGATVNAGDLLGVIAAGSGKSAPAATPKAAAAESKAAPEKPAAAPASSAAQPGPAARKQLAEHQLKSDDVQGSGKGGRVTKEDVSRHLEGGNSGAAAPAGAREEQRVPMTRIRARIAERLVQAQATAAMLTTFNEVDLNEIMALRARHKEAFEKANGVKLGFMSFFVKAAIEALRKYPAVNASIDGSDIIYHGYYDIGIAVSSPRGLVVPIVRDVDQLSFAEIEKSIGAFGTKAKDNKLTMDDLTGGTFSITNGGVFGSMLSTPILNPPQSAILGMHGILQRPMAVDGAVVIRPMMYLALTYDHRIIDGKEAVLFLRAIKDSLEDPSRLLLQL